jgi:hypothetical protein
LRTFSHFFAFLHFVVHILCIFLALFATFWCINREILTKEVEKVRNAKKCDANAMQCDELSQKVQMRMQCEKVFALPSLLHRERPYVAGPCKGKKFAKYVAPGRLGPRE